MTLLPNIYYVANLPNVESDCGRHTRHGLRNRARAGQDEACSVTIDKAIISIVVVIVSAIVVFTAVIVIVITYSN